MFGSSHLNSSSAHPCPRLNSSAPRWHFWQRCHPLQQKPDDVGQQCKLRLHIQFSDSLDNVHQAPQSFHRQQIISTEEGQR